MVFAGEVDLLFEINPVCESFEAAIQTGETPQIEEFLIDWDGDRRRVLFQQLLEIELFYHEESGSTAAPEEYARRFPEYGSTIANTFEVQQVKEQPTGAAIPGTSLDPGSRFGSYTIVGEIGRGGMGIVYEARHIALDRSVALKLLPALGQGNETARQRFLGEARAVARLHHGNIVPVFDVGEVGGAPYYAMQLIDGVPLREWIGGWIEDRSVAGSSGSQPEDPAAFRERSRAATRVALQIAQALQYAHERGVIHRDVKPSNILVDRAGVAWLVDFGLARLDDGDLTTSQDLLGTVRYMAPERFGGACTAAGDVYALGVTLMECLTGRRAFQAENHAGLIREILSGRRRPVRTVVPAISRDLETIVEKATAPRIQDRYRTPGELALDLDRLLAGLPIEARRPKVAERLVRWADRNRAAAALVAVLSLTAMTATIAARSFLRQRDAISAQRKELSDFAANETSLLAKSEAARADLRVTLYRSDMQRATLDAFSTSGGARLSDILAPWDTPGEEVDPRGWEWYLLRSFVSRSTSVPSLFAGNSVEWSPNGELFATGGRSGAALWDAQTGQILVQLDADSHVRDLSWSQSGQRLALRDFTGVRVFSSDGQLLASRPHGREDTSFCWGADDSTLVVCGERGSWWDYMSDEMTPLGPSDRTVKPSKISADGRFSAEIYLHAITILDTSTWETVATPTTGGPNLVESVEFSLDGERIVAASRDDTIHIWETRTGIESVAIPNAHATTINHVRWSDDGKFVVSASADAAMKIWDAQTGALVRRCVGHEGPVQDAAFAPESETVASVSLNGELRRWDVGKLPAAIVLNEPAYGTRPLELAWHPSGRAIAFSTLTKLYFYDLSQAAPVLLRSEPGAIPSWSPDGRFLIRLFDDHATVHDSETDQLLATLDGDTVASQVGKTKRLAWTAGGALYVNTGGMTNAYPRLPATEWVSVIPRVDDLAFDPGPTGRFHAARIGYGKVLIQHAGTGSLQCELAPDRIEWDYPGATPQPIWSPNEQRLAIINGSRLLIFDPISGALLTEFNDHSGSINSAAWSPNNKRIATACDDRTVGLFDPDVGLITRLTCNAAIVSVRWTPDGKRLAALSSIGQAYVWDAAVGLDGR